MQGPLERMSPGSLPSPLTTTPTRSSHKKILSKGHVQDRAVVQDLLRGFRISARSLGDLLTRIWTRSRKDLWRGFPHDLYRIFLKWSALYKNLLTRISTRSCHKALYKIMQGPDFIRISIRSYRQPWTPRAKTHPQRIHTHVVGTNTYDLICAYKLIVNKLKLENLNAKMQNGKTAFSMRWRMHQMGKLDLFTIGSHREGSTLYHCASCWG